MILFYAAEGHQEKEKIHHLMASHPFGRPVVPFDSLEALEARLRRPHQDVDVILICIEDAIEMIKLTRLRSLLIDLRIVMVLPCRDADMVSWAHKLGPRFIAYGDNSDQQIGSVLEKMLGKSTSHPKLLDLDHYRHGRL